jgi:hypothetical protein
VVQKTHSFLSELHPRDVDRLPYLEAALKDLSTLIEEDRVVKEGEKRKKNRGKFALMKPLRLALSGKKVSKIDVALDNKDTDDCVSCLPSPLQSGPTVAEAISLLGQDLTLQRLRAALQHPSL